MHDQQEPSIKCNAPYALIDRLHFQAQCPSVLAYAMALRLQASSVGWSRRLRPWARRRQSCRMATASSLATR